MNRMINFGKRLSPCLSDVVRFDLKEEKTDVAEANKQLLDFIYSRDPNTGLPCGDIAIFLSKNANPQVRQFIETSLMNPQAQPSGLSLSQEVINKFGDVINDDDIAYFSRNHGETNEEFADRMRLFMEHEKSEVARKKQNADMKKMIEKAKKSLNAD